MGLYDTFLGDVNNDGIRTAVQVKFTQVVDGLPSYKVGDLIPLHIAECVIIGYEGYVVIENSIVIQVGQTIYNKWGNLLEPPNIISRSNPIVNVLDDLNLTDLEQTSPEELAEIIDLELEVHEEFEIGLPPVMLTNLEFRSLIAWTKAVLRGEVSEAQRIFSKMPPKLLELIDVENVEENSKNWLDDELPI